MSRIFRPIAFLSLGLLFVSTLVSILTPSRSAGANQAVDDPSLLHYLPLVSGRHEWKIGYVGESETGYDIYTLDSYGNSERITYLDQSSPSMYPDWTADGQQLVYSADNVIYKARPDGTNPVSLALGNRPVWSPDGTRIAFSSTAYDNNLTIYVMDADGANRRSVVQGSAPAWSPDGRELVYQRQECEFGSFGFCVYIKEVDGPDDRLVMRDAFYAAFSPDGNFLVVHWDDDFVTLYLRDNSWLRLGFGYDAEWSPDGNWILYRISVGGTSQIFIVRPDATFKRQITYSPFDVSQPTWIQTGP